MKMNRLGGDVLAARRLGEVSDRQSAFETRHIRTDVVVKESPVFRQRRVRGVWSPAGII